MSRKHSSTGTGVASHRFWWKSRLILTLAAAVCGAAAIWLYFDWRQRMIASELAAASEALEQSQFELAGRSAERVLRSAPSHPAALIIAARCAATDRDWGRAFSLCDRLTGAELREAKQQFLALGKQLVESGECRRAEEVLRLLLHLDPRNSDAAFVLAFVFATEGRAWEAAPLIRDLIEQERFDMPQLLVVAAPDEFFINQPEFIKRCQEARPDDPLPLLVEARNAISANDFVTAESTLRRVLKSDSWLIEAQVRWGHLLLSQNRDQEFLVWHRDLPSAADSHPETWVLRGLWSIRSNQPQAAIRCFGEGVRLDPNLRAANFHLGRLLADAGSNDLAVKFQERSQLLSELRIPLGSIMQQRDVAILQRIIDLLEKLGRPREAVAWAELFLREADGAWAQQLVIRLHSQFPAGLPWITDSHRLADQLDLSAYPLPEW